MRRIFLTIFILILGISCSNDEKIIIARFDNGYVTLKEAINEYDNLSDKTKEEIKTKNDYFKHVRKIHLKKFYYLKHWNRDLIKKKNL